MSDETHTEPNDATIAEDEREAEQAHVADREATAEEERAARRSARSLQRTPRTSPRTKSRCRGWAPRSRARGRRSSKSFIGSIRCIIGVIRCIRSIDFILEFAASRGASPSSATDRACQYLTRRSVFETITAVQHGDSSRSQRGSARFSSTFRRQGFDRCARWVSRLWRRRCARPRSVADSVRVPDRLQLNGLELEVCCAWEGSGMGRGWRLPAALIVMASALITLQSGSLPGSGAERVHR